MTPATAPVTNAARAATNDAVSAASPAGPAAVRSASVAPSFGTQAVPLASVPVGMGPAATSIAPAAQSAATTAPAPAPHVEATITALAAALAGGDAPRLPLVSGMPTTERRAPAGPHLQMLRRDAKLPANAAGVAVAASEDEPVAVSVAGHGPRPARAPGQFALGCGLTMQLADKAADAPAHVLFTWTGAASAGLRELAGPSLRQAAMLLAPLLQSFGAKRFAGVALQLDLGRGGGAAGTVRLADGKRIKVGSEPPCPQLVKTANGQRPLAESARATLHLLAGSADEGDDWRACLLGPYVTFALRRHVRVDLAPVESASVWRLDDTEGLAAVGAGDVRSATRAARAVLDRLRDGLSRLDQMGPSEGFGTFDGSPLSLALADVAKPVGLGIALGESEPPRLDVLRTAAGDWIVGRLGGAFSGAGRLRYGAAAIDEATLNLQVQFGLPPGADEEPPMGRLGQHAVAGFTGARALMTQAGWLGDREAAARAREAWLAIARDWAAVIQRLALADRLLDRVAPSIGAPAMADLLADQAARSGSLAAWHVVRQAEMDVGALLGALRSDPDRQLAAAKALAPAAAMEFATALQGGGGPRGADGGGVVEFVAAATDRAAGAAALLAWGEAELARFAALDPAPVSRPAGIAIAARLGRLAVPAAPGRSAAA